MPRYDRTFNGMKSRKVDQNEIDHHVAEAHGPDSVPRRTTTAPTSTRDPLTAEADAFILPLDDEYWDEMASYESTPPPASAVVGPRFMDVLLAAP
jgi:hypothetical protein